ncbi:MAG: TetR/AcrR family transcriptional regulator [Flavobacterium sp.]|nr:TetR/AcrR family transcriptional regulator [Flavobacterium sp.]
MATQRKKKETTQEDIVTWYTDYCLSHGKKPNSIYEFSKQNGFEETHFYKYFASFEELESDYFSKMFYYTLDLLKENKEYAQYDSAQKLIGFYFTFMEMATANRSFVKFLLEEGKLPLKNITKLKVLRQDFLAFVKTILEAPLKIENEKITNIQNKLVHEGTWLQFMSIISFWMHDTSASFEKTDIYIEKSVKASFDMVYNVPIESIVDFAKFIWKEKMGSGFTYKN